MAKFGGYQQGRNLRIQEFAVTRSMTTATQVANLPLGSRIVGFVLSGIASNAGTTATLSIGNTATATEYVNAVSVLAGGVGNGVSLLNGVAGAVGAVLTGNMNPVYVKYAETGAASSAGAWKLYLIYTDGNKLFDPTI